MKQHYTCIFLISFLLYTLSVYSQVNFQVIPSQGCPGVQVQIINNLNINYTPVPNQTTGISYSWNFGNGQTSTAQHPSGITYTNPGQYTISYSATIDTVGFILTQVDVTGAGCTDPFGGAPDMYIIIRDGNNQIVYSTQSAPYNDAHPPVQWFPNLPLKNPPYYFWIWDRDSYDSDDNCINDSESQPGASTLIQLPPNTPAYFGNSSYNGTNGALQYKLYFNKPVQTINETYVYTVHAGPAPPALSYYNGWFCTGQTITPIQAFTLQNCVAQWYADSLLTNLLHTGNTFQFQPLTQGTYRIYVIQKDSTTGCNSTASVCTINVSNAPSPVVINNNRIFCYNEMLSPLIAIGDSIYWFADASLQNLIHTGDTFYLTVQQPGTYQFWVLEQKSTGCLSEPAHVQITISPPLEAQISKTPVTCYGLNDGTATITPLNGYPPYIYIWSNGQQTQTASNLPPGPFTVVLIDSAFCLRTFADTIQNATPLLVEATLEHASCIEHGPKGNITLHITGGKQPYTIVCNNQPASEMLTNLLPGTYHVHISDANNCTYDTSFVIQRMNDCLTIATVLTPNNDGKNDTWIIQSIEYYPEAEISVFDRNGRKVFHSKNTYTPWDGTHNGKPLPAGSYYYLIYLHPNDNPLTGTVDIIR